MVPHSYHDILLTNLEHVFHLFSHRSYNYIGFVLKVSKVAKIRNRYNQVPHLTQDTNVNKNSKEITHLVYEVRLWSLLFPVSLIYV